MEALREELRLARMEREKFHSDLEQQVQEKVSQAIQEFLPHQSAEQTVTKNQFETLLAIQHQSFQDLSSRILQTLHLQRVEMLSLVQNSTMTVATGKRSVETPGDTSSMTDSNAEMSDDRKRLDDKPTPMKLDFPADRDAIYEAVEQRDINAITGNSQTVVSIQEVASPESAQFARSTFLHGSPEETSYNDQNTFSTPKRDYALTKLSVGPSDNNNVTVSMHAEVQNNTTGSMRSKPPE